MDFGNKHLIDASPSPASGSISISTPTILICGHGSRDERCGIFGPLLEKEFLTRLRDAGIEPTLEPPTGHNIPQKQARVGLVSHIGGHKWAGNVIIYMPPSESSSPQGKVNALAGRGIWYGRVEPRHVEGIVKETVLGGRVIEELCRGVV